MSSLLTGWAAWHLVHCPSLSLAVQAVGYNATDGSPWYPQGDTSVQDRHAMGMARGLAMARHLFSNAVVGVSASPAVAAFATRSPLADPFVRRFVAGESLDDALQVARRLQAQGLLVTLDHLGENVTSVAGAEAARRTSEDTLLRIAA